jgi:hypothetical protein
MELDIDGSSRQETPSGSAYVLDERYNELILKQGEEIRWIDLRKPRLN